MNRILSLQQELSRHSVKQGRRRRKHGKGAAKSRAYSRASNYSETLYGTGEHVLAGEVNSSPISTTYALDVNGVDFTYGELIAMGDLYETHVQMISAPKSELRKLKQLIVKSKQFHEGRIVRGRPTGSDVKQGEWQRATKKRYIKLAEDNFSHFAPSSSYLIPNFSSTKTSNKKEWEHYHQKAIEKAMSGTSSLDLEQALIINAFGDHFLTDAFAAGHLVNKDAINAYFKSRVFNGSELNSNGEKMLEEIARKAFTGKLKSAFSKYETYEPHDAWWNIFNWNPNIHKVDRFKLLLAGIMKTEPDIIGKTLVAKLIHDALNKYRGGVAVTDSNGNHWKLTGDDSLDQINLDIMREAVMQSIINIDDAAAGKNLSLAMMFGRVWEKVPIPTSGSKAMIKGLVKKYTNPLGSKLTDGAARLLQDNFKELLDELVDRRILKKA